MQLEVLAKEAAECTGCDLAATRTRVVFGVGDPGADLMFVGEAPGFHEDQQGIPFVGRAGQLLTDMLGEIGLARDDVYIGNVLKCRPPNNRDPLPTEISACTPWLDRQLESIGPLVVVTLGNFATKYLLETTVGITRLRGRRFKFRGRVLVPTFHPAAVLRSGPTKLQDMRDDFQLIRRSIDAARARIAAGGAAGDLPPGDAEDLGPGQQAATPRSDDNDTEDPDVEQLGLF